MLVEAVDIGLTLATAGAIVWLSRIFSGPQRTGRARTSATRERTVGVINDISRDRLKRLVAEVDADIFSGKVVPPSGVLIASDVREAMKHIEQLEEENRRLLDRLHKTEE